MNKWCFIVFYFPIFLFAQQSVIKEIEIMPFMHTQNYEHFKRLALTSSNSEVEYIEGFDFEWGYYYTLKVEETYIGELSEGSRYDYSLLKEISKKKAADTVTFVMYIDPLRYYYESEDEGISNSTLNKLNDSTYLYMDNVEIEIPKKALQFIRKRIDNKSAFVGYFKYVNSHRIRLTGLRPPTRKE